MKCPLCHHEVGEQTAHACDARKGKLVVVHPNGPKQPGQDAQAHADLAARNLELLNELRDLKAVRLTADAVIAAADRFELAFVRGFVPEMLSARDELMNATRAHRKAKAEQAKERAT